MKIYGANVWIVSLKKAPVPFMEVFVIPSVRMNSIGIYMSYRQLIVSFRVKMYTDICFKLGTIVPSKMELCTLVCFGMIWAISFVITMCFYGAGLDTSVAVLLVWTLMCRSILFQCDHSTLEFPRNFLL